MDVSIVLPVMACSKGTADPFGYPSRLLDERDHARQESVIVIDNYRLLSLLLHVLANHSGPPIHLRLTQSACLRLSRISSRRSRMA